MTASRKFGQPTRRREDAPLLTGRADFVADLVRPGMAAMRVVRASVAHARLRGIDFSAVANDPACLGFLSAHELPAGTGALPAADLVADSKPAHHGVLAREVVRYVGEPVAVVLAVDAYAAEDLAERVAIDYEPLPVVMDVHSGIKPGSALLYPQFGSNIVHQTTQLVGDPDGAFAAADIIVDETFSFQRVAANSMEMRGAIATLDAASGRYLVHSSTQIPQILRKELARITGIAPERLRVIAPQVGGGFGAKEAVYAEEILVLLALQRFGRATYWLEDRQESFIGSCHGREQSVRLRAAVTAAGIVTAVEVECLSDIGAAYQFLGNTPGAAIASVRGPYRIPNFRSRARSVVTNKTPLNVYRGAGYPQAIAAMERVMDLAATATGLDAAQIRRRNLLPPEAFPVERGIAYPGCGPVVFDSGNFPALLDSTLDAVDYPRFALRRARTAPEIALGLGLSFVVEMTGGGGGEPARLRLRPDGRLQLLSGIVPIGQGSETTLAQILADHLGVAIESIDVLSGDTDDSPDSPGTFASRGATMGGNAACRAADALIHRACRLAAELRGARAADIAWQDGVLVDRTRPGESLTLAALMQQAQAAGVVPAGGLDAAACYNDDAVSWSSACHAAVVEVDRGTGVVRVVDYAVTHDCGRIANPLLVDGQVMGGAVQGLGQCLFEEIRYDPAGLPLSKGYMDYVLPSAATVPRFTLRHIQTPSPLNPLGMKGAGEAGCSGAVAAIANAIANALGPQTTVPNGSGPFTPQLLHRILQGAPREEASA
ncbi:MAG TPA: xanthine dehydrogenase family protein molybdopterin-binding subunit [Steroidobacteraceae bacterium]|nr:xanthine dehydrogenase family protein molybdopterin-binding subunit [Steroidobacteraceae bacterium]